MKLFGKILASFFAILVPIALVGVIAYLLIPGVKTKVDDALNNLQNEEVKETETEGTEEQVPETTAFVSFSNNTIKIEV